MERISPKRAGRKSSPRKERPAKVHIFAGSSPARGMLELGLAVDRALKRQSVCVVQFLGNPEQMASLEDLRLPVVVDICKYETEAERQEACAALGGAETARNGLAQATEALQSGRYDVVVLAEATTAIACNLVSAQDIVKLIEQKAPETELILTGSCVDRAVARLAETITELVQGPSQVDVIDSLGLEYWRADPTLLKKWAK